MKNKLKEETNTILERPPVIAVMGHIDHGKSTLLDYIRKTNVVAKEAGGITQRISAYELIHKNEKGEEKKITFIDTPGHEAFSKMRERGAKAADIAILVVSAEDGVKPQTIEAWKTIENSQTPVIIAINKIDKEGANIEKTKASLAEAGIFLENYGGKIPFAPISAKVGTGVDELLDLINILAELENFQGDKSIPAEGFVIEADLDPKRGIQATLLIKNGSLKKGMTIATGNSTAGTRIVEDFTGKAIKEATFSSPVRVVGFDKMPEVGARWQAFVTKDEAIEYTRNTEQTSSKKDDTANENNDKKIIPVVLKADSMGSIEALEREIYKVKSESAEWKIVSKGSGPITEGDIKYLTEGKDAIVIGFNVDADSIARELAERKGVKITFFDVIYKMSEWLKEEMETMRPKIAGDESLGKLQIFKVFSKTKERQVVGGRVTEGKLVLKEAVKIIRRDFEIGLGKIVNLEKNKVKVSEVESGSDCGLMVEAKIEIAQGDILECFKRVER